MATLPDFTTGSLETRDAQWLLNRINQSNQGVSQFAVEIPQYITDLLGTQGNALDSKYVDPYRAQQYMADTGLRQQQWSGIGPSGQPELWSWMEDAQGNKITEPIGGTTYDWKDKLAVMLTGGALGGIALSSAGLLGGAAPTSGAAAADYAAAADASAGLLPAYGTNAAYDAAMASAMTPAAQAAIEAQIAADAAASGGAGASSYAANAADAMNAPTTFTETPTTTVTEPGTVPSNPGVPPVAPRTGGTSGISPDVLKLLFPALGALGSQLGGSGDSGGYSYNGPMPTITRGGWSPNAQAGLMQVPQYGNGLLMPQSGNGLLRYLGGK
jgi:hypothetical protein